IGYPTHLGLDLPHRRPGLGVLVPAAAGRGATHAARPLPRAAAAGKCPILRRGRGARGPVRAGGCPDGQRGDQADHRNGPAAAGPGAHPRFPHRPVAADPAAAAQRGARRLAAQPAAPSSSHHRAARTAHNGTLRRRTVHPRGTGGPAATAAGSRSRRAELRAAGRARTVRARRRRDPRCHTGAVGSGADPQRPRRIGEGRARDRLLRRRTARRTRRPGPGRSRIHHLRAHRRDRRLAGTMTHHEHAPAQPFPDRPDTAPRSVGQHQVALAELTPALEPVRLGLAEAGGCVLAEDVRSRTPIPLFDNSAMDGYAVHAQDLADAGERAPVTLPVVADLPAGETRRQRIEPGQVARIMTGAPLPEGADAGRPVEHTDGGTTPAASGPRPPPGPTCAAAARTWPPATWCSAPARSWVAGRSPRRPPAGTATSWCILARAWRWSPPVPNSFRPGRRRAGGRFPIPTPTCWPNPYAS